MPTGNGKSLPLGVVGRRRPRYEKHRSERAISAIAGHRLGAPQAQALFTVETYERMDERFVLPCGFAALI
jgi:hypothetical protein